MMAKHVLIFFAGFLIMLGGSNNMDSSSILFDPNGRLRQVEYAYKATSLGQTVVATRTDTICLVFTVQDKKHKVKSSSLKIYRINDNLCLTASGIISDFVFAKRKLIDIITNHIYNYGVNPPLVRLGSSMAEIFHEKTLSAEYRPLGIRLLIIGYDEHSKASIIEVDPFGNLFNCRISFLGKYCEDISKEWNKILTAPTSQADLNLSSHTTQPVKDAIVIIKNMVRTLSICLARENDDLSQSDVIIGALGENMPYFEFSHSAVENAIFLDDFDGIAREMTNIDTPS